MVERKRFPQTFPANIFHVVRGGSRAIAHFTMRHDVKLGTLHSRLKTRDVAEAYNILSQAYSMEGDQGHQFGSKITICHSVPRERNTIVLRTNATPSYFPEPWPLGFPIYLYAACMVSFLLQDAGRCR